MSTLFISDLHLDPSRPAVTRAFLSLMQRQAPAADALYILGDFFEAWIGDDDDSELNLAVIGGLKRLTDTTPVYLMHGNRDFLIGQQFCQQTGCQLIADPTVIDCYGQPVLLMHGDTLCTDDSAYMDFRRQCRSTPWQEAMLSRPVAERRLLAEQMRAQSQQANSNKASAIMDVNQAEVIRVMEQQQVSLLIHGHTHRPHVHDITLATGPGQRVVLGDWLEQGWLVRFEPDHSYHLEAFAIED